MKAVSITGFKNSGKTTLTLLLAEALEKRGLRVAIAKRSHHALDKPATDTARLRAPGRVVLGISESETAIFWGEERPLADMLPLLRADILLLEGGKNRHWLPRVLCLHHAAEAEALHHAAEAEALHQGLAVASYGLTAAPGLPHFDENTLAELAALVEEKAFALPGLDCGACGHFNCQELAQAIVRGEAEPAACVPLAGGDVRIHINGQLLPLNPFTARVLGGAVRGMLREMKGVAPGNVEIELKI